MDFLDQVLEVIEHASFEVRDEVLDLNLQLFELKFNLLDLLEQEVCFYLMFQQIFIAIKQFHKLLCLNNHCREFLLVKLVYDVLAGVN